MAIHLHPWPCGGAQVAAGCYMTVVEMRYASPRSSSKDGMSPISRIFASVVGALLCASLVQAQAQEPTRNVILFVPDGLRALSVTPESAPTMAALRDRGVNFKNPHSLFPTLTMPNSSGMATGHHLGDNGSFGNAIYTGFPVTQSGNRSWSTVGYFSILK